MKKLLAIVMTLVLALTMTTTAFAAPKSGAAGITWEEGGGPDITDPPPTGFSAFGNRDFRFGTQTMTVADQDLPSINEGTPAKGEKAGVVVKNESATPWTVQVRVGGFYLGTDTTKAGTQYMKGFILTLNHAAADKKVEGAADFSVGPNTGVELRANSTAGTEGQLGAPATLAKGGFGLYGANWTASLHVPAASEKVASALTAELEWNVVTGA